jgi:sugar/nucleoside kinase (ribokinase family)
MKRILGIGNALVDIITLLPDEHILEEFSLPKGSMQMVDSGKSDNVKAATENLNRRLASGGSAANTIHGLAMLGTETGFIGSVGTDELGDFFERDMNNAGVKTSLRRRKSVTGTAVALITPDSERTFATHLGAAVELVEDDLDTRDFSGYDILYLEGYLIFNKPLVEKACQLARANKMKIALDLASYNVVEAKLSDFKEIVEKYVDIIFANEEEAKAYTGLDPEEALNLLSCSCEIAVVKIGKNGSLIRRGEEVLKIDSINVNTRDTTGAGDLYASGFLYGLTRGSDLEKDGITGTLLAGNVIEIIGARMDIEKWKLINKSVRKIFEDE